MGAATRVAPGDAISKSHPYRRSARRENHPGFPSYLQGEAHRVLADRDHVAVGELLFDHGLAVDQCAVGAPEVADPEKTVPGLDPAVVTGGRRGSDDDVVIRRPAEAHHLAGEGDNPARKRP